MHVHTPTRLHTDPRIQAQLENLWQKWVKGQKAEITLSPGEKRGRKGRKKDSEAPRRAGQDLRTQDRREAESGEAAARVLGGGNQERRCSPPGKGGGTFRTWGPVPGTPAG